MGLIWIAVAIFSLWFSLCLVFYLMKVCGRPKSDWESVPVIATFLVVLYFFGIGAYWLVTGDFWSPTLAAFLDAAGFDLAVILKPSGLIGLDKIAKWTYEQSLNWYVPLLACALWPIASHAANSAWDPSEAPKA